MRPSKFAKPLDELAALVGVSVPTLRANFKAGAPSPARGSKVETWVAKFHQWRKANVGNWNERQAQEARTREGKESQGHKTELAKWRAAEAKLRVGEATRALVSRKEVVEFASRAILTVRSRMNAMVSKMQSRLENVPGHVVAEELQAEVDSICAAFAQGMEQTHGEP
jgi:phage terminase Nu1 subunit (DNA packaging protein)